MRRWPNHHHPSQPLSIMPGSGLRQTNDGGMSSQWSRSDQRIPVYRLEEIVWKSTPMQAISELVVWFWLAGARISGGELGSSCSHVIRKIAAGGCQAAIRLHWPAGILKGHELPDSKRVEGECLPMNRLNFAFSIES